MKTYIGIDPGLKGGIAMIGVHGIATIPMPTKQFGRRNTVDIIAMRRHLISVFDPFIIIEAAQKFSAGTNALTSTWFGFGRITALIEMMGIPHEVIASPQTWQKEFWTRPKLPKGQKFDTKQASLLAAGRLWPNHDFRPTERCTNASDGLTDAALIAEYGRRNNL